MQSTVDYIGENGNIIINNPFKQEKDARKIFSFNKVFGQTVSQGMFCYSIDVHLQVHSNFQRYFETFVIYDLALNWLVLHHLTIFMMLNFLSIDIWLFTYQSKSTLTLNR